MKSKSTLLILFCIVAVVVFALEFFVVPKGQVGLLPVLSFWTAIGQGLIALSAAVTLSDGKWLAPINKYLMKAHPLLLLTPIGFIIFSRHIEAYGWMHHHTAWLEPTFFVVRNMVLSIITYFLALLYVRSVEKDTPSKRRNAVFYVLAFVTCQSVQAVDWFMSFDYPFINTMFGPFFFVEALYIAVAVGVLMSVVFYKRNKAKYENILRDCVTFMMGLALFWAGLFYSQYLVIWYGNIPEEVDSFVKRTAHPDGLALGIITLVTLFLIPFFTLIPRKIKVVPAYVTFVALLVLAGVFLERILFLVDVAKYNVFIMVPELAVFGVPFIYYFREQLKAQEQEI